MFFYDMTHHIESLKRESEVLDRKNQSRQTLNYRTFSNEFRSPLQNALMFLDSLLGEQLVTQAKHLVTMVISQVNMLSCLVNDVLDLNEIEECNFTPK